MPLFDYACRDCDHRFEALVQNRAKPACPECESDRVQDEIGFRTLETRGVRAAQIQSSSVGLAAPPPRGR